MSTPEGVDPQEYRDALALDELLKHADDGGSLDLGTLPVHLREVAIRAAQAAQARPRDLPLITSAARDEVRQIVEAETGEAVSDEDLDRAEARVQAIVRSLKAQTGVALKPADLLARHAALRERFQHPNKALVDYAVSFATSVAESRDLGTAALFFYPFLDPASYDRTWPRKFCGAVSRGLFDARTFQVTAPMVDKLHEVYDAIYKKLVDIKETELPYHSGFAWLDKSWVHVDLHGEPNSMRAVSWSPQTVTYQRLKIERTDAFGRPLPDSKDPETIIPGVRLVFWSKSDDPYLADKLGLGRHPEKLDFAEQQLGDLTIAHTVVIGFGERMRIQGPGENEDFASDLGVMVKALWYLLSMELPGSEAHRAPIGRPDHRRALRNLKLGEVNVITLRRYQPPPSDPDREPGYREYTCRWTVQGFNRHKHRPEDGHRPLPFGGTCGTCGEPITFVHAHIRGPKDQPLREQKQLYKLVR